jgi:hypothetical protein
MMANRSNGYLGKPAPGSSAEERVDLNGTQVTETIKASGQMIPRKQAGHMTATDHAIKTKIFLLKPGRPHMIWASRSAAGNGPDGAMDFFVIDLVGNESEISTHYLYGVPSR